MLCENNNCKTNPIAFTMKFLLVVHLAEYLEWHDCIKGTVEITGKVWLQILERLLMDT